MSDIVNLRLARKRKRRAEKESVAAANRLRHGRSAAEQQESLLARRLDEKRLDGHRRAPLRPGDDEG
jgi:hypothetical protein